MHWRCRPAQRALGEPVPTAPSVRRAGWTGQVGAAHLGVFVGRDDDVVDVLAEGGVLHRGGDRLDLRVDQQRVTVQIVGPGLLAGRTDGAQRHEARVVLPLVTNHHDVRNGRAQRLDVVLDRYLGRTR